MNNADLSVSDRFEAYDALFHTGQKLLQYFEDHEQILISVSGGSDSNIIIHLICAYFPEYLEKCHFVWVNTGLEYQAGTNFDFDAAIYTLYDRVTYESLKWVTEGVTD